ncbi:HNH endonuclease [Nocardioides terrae]|uniref:HNH endonuclease n=1 Tax=Nocardioides terrae TaxID=574651 RepID=UPI001C31C39A|nr:DUF222 domain-containing protein [Nocardioides terrae]
MENLLTPVDADEVRAWVQRVAGAPIASDDGARVDELRELETLKAAIEARQARIAVDFDASQRALAAERGVPAARQGRGIAEQIALARRISPHRGRVLLGAAKSIHAEMPHTARAWREGRITEWRALTLGRETACLTREDRGTVDAELARDAEALEAKSDRQVEGEARVLAARLDAASVVERRRRAEAERCVTIRPAPDSMVYLTALLPIARGVAVYAALRRAADTAVGTGVATNRGQVMADTLATRVLGQIDSDTSAPGGKPVVPVTINLVMSARTLLDRSDDPAEIAGFGPIPASLARQLVADALDAKTRVWLRRLYAEPLSGRLIAMDSERRLFPRQLGDFLQLRDRFCRNPWCNSLIRHNDHAQPAEAGGDTSADNGQGLCEQCNHAKQAAGWHTRVVDRPGRTHTVEITTPTGHTYRSQAPPAPGTGLQVRVDLRFAA